MTPPKNITVNDSLQLQNHGKIFSATATEQNIQESNADNSKTLQTQTDDPVSATVEARIEPILLMDHNYVHTKQTRTPSKFACCYCEKKFSSKYDLTIHQSEH